MDQSKKALTAYCGIFCPECYKMKVSETATSLKQQLEQAKTKSAVKPFVSNSCFQEWLGGLINLRCEQFCREGGGKVNCEVKLCCLEKSLEGCWQCEDVFACEKASKYINYIQRIKTEN